MPMSRWGFIVFDSASGHSLISQTGGSLWGYAVYISSSGRTNIYQGASLWGWMEPSPEGSVYPTKVFQADGSHWGWAYFDLTTSQTVVLLAAGTEYARIYWSAEQTVIDSSGTVSENNMLYEDSDDLDYEDGTTLLFED
jgi:hypothetical protein